MRPLDGRVKRVERQSTADNGPDEWAEMIRSMKELDRQRRARRKKAPPSAPAAVEPAKPEPAPPVPEPPVSPLDPVPAEPFHDTHEIPEHMQIRPVQWRLRGPQDRVGDEDEPMTPDREEYDPFREYEDWE